MVGINLVLLTIVLFVFFSQTSAFGKCQNYSKCQNGGFCEEHIDPYERKLFATCHCLPSFTGPFCESAISNTADASNCGSGLYTVIDGKEKCICRPGEKGPHCFDDSNNLRACLSTAECTMDPVTYQLKCDCGNGKRFSFGGKL